MANHPGSAKSVRSKRVTIKDIAQRCGVSNMTVSVVLSRNETSHVRVSEATRARVRAVAEELQYRPNRAARMLRSGASNVIGVYSKHGYLNPYVPFTAQLIGGLHLGCELHERDLLLHGSYRDRAPEDIRAELADGRVDGVVLYTFAADPLVASLAASDLPVVAVVDALPDLPSVVADDAGGGRLLAEHLAARGHRRVFYRTGLDRLVSAMRRREGFLAAAEELGMQVTVQYPRGEDYQHEEFRAGDLGWLALPRDQRPTAAVCWNDNTAYHLLDHCRAAGIRVPEELAVAGYDDIPPPHNMPWRLTTVQASWVDVARTAVDLLLQRLSGAEIPRETTLPVRLIVGDTA